MNASAAATPPLQTAAMMEGAAHAGQAPDRTRRVISPQGQPLLFIASLPDSVSSTICSTTPRHGRPCQLHLSMRRHSYDTAAGQSPPAPRRAWPLHAPSPPLQIRPSSRAYPSSSAPSPPLQIQPSSMAYPSSSAPSSQSSPSTASSPRPSQGPTRPP
ncbi:unnamed protein product [Triticum turgidum subsp. durum]|uniref:Uncharacterized protein n=1 Tax=Triticum turgidum subsp. durum TaxID=4567 RepID=A0A9R1PNF8_TRITD|nr:unnamed protein product [Triticum turgidum subsp. durum]